MRIEKLTPEIERLIEESLDNKTYLRLQAGQFISMNILYANGYTINVHSEDGSIYLCDNELNFGSFASSKTLQQKLRRLIAEVDSKAEKIVEGELKSRLNLDGQSESKKRVPKWFWPW